jgi:hypothetical protein
MSEDTSKDSAVEDESHEPDPVDAEESDDDDQSTDSTSDGEPDSEDAPKAEDASAGRIPDDRPEHLTERHFLTARWRGHDIAVSGDWTLRWLFLAPTYTLWVDGKPVETIGGPRVEPSLDAVLEDETGEAYHLTATLTSILGYAPPCKISIEGEVIAEGDLRVANFINPFLVLFILIAAGVMLYVGPDVLARYMPR